MLTLKTPTFSHLLSRGRFSETHLMTSAENSVLERPNLKRSGEDTPRTPTDKIRAFGTRYNASRCQKNLATTLLTPKLSPYILACQQSSSRVNWTHFLRILRCWQANSRETKLVVTQRLVWLCKPMCEWQSLLHTAQMKSEEGRVELFLRRARFFSAFVWGFKSALSMTSFTVRLQQARSLVATSKLFGSISINLLSPVVNCPCRTSLRMRRSFMRWACPSHLMLVTWSCHLTPRMRLRHHRWKEFKRCSCLV